MYFQTWKAMQNLKLTKFIIYGSVPAKQFPSVRLSANVYVTHPHFMDLVSVHAESKLTLHMHMWVELFQPVWLSDEPLIHLQEVFKYLSYKLFHVTWLHSSRKDFVHCIVEVHTVYHRWFYMNKLGLHSSTFLLMYYACLYQIRLYRKYLNRKLIYGRVVFTLLPNDIWLVL